MKSQLGCVLWNLNSSHIQRLYVTWRKIIRKIWNVPYNTHCILLPILMSDHDIQTQLLLRFSKFTSNVFCHNNQLVRMCARLSCHSDTPFASTKRLLAYYVNRNDVLSKSDKNSKFVHDKIVSRNIILDDIIVIGNCIRDGILQCDFDSSDIDDMIKQASIDISDIEQPTILCVVCNSFNVSFIFARFHVYCTFLVRNK